MCCIDLDALVLVCMDTSDSRHGAQVTEIIADDPSGISVTWMDRQGKSGKGRFPRCVTTSDCCYDANKGVIVCPSPSDPLHNQSAELVEEYGNGYVYICFSTGRQRGEAPCFDPETGIVVGGAYDGVSPPEGSWSLSEDGTWVTIFGLAAEDTTAIPDVRLPVCPPGKTCLRLPLCAEPPQIECCYDAVNGVLVCDDPAINGQAPELVSELTDDSGTPYVVVRHPGLNEGNRTTIPLCPDQPPVDCCYDVATGTLRCPGNPEYDGLEVSLETMGKDAQGNDVASVSHPDLPGGGYRFPLCIDTTPPDCCYDGKREVLVCPNDPEYDGRPAAVVSTFEGPDGSTWVYVAWEGGGATMPLCTEECPPEFCCVNVHTMTFVCARSELNGQAADVADIITTEDGFNVAVLTDGTRVPMCGRECPPPRLCPPGCPTGQWMSPDGECKDPPKCPPPGDPCPPGYWRDPNGICRRPPECPPCDRPPRGEPPGKTCPPGRPDDRFPPPPPPPPPPCPWWQTEGHCCENCALGQVCSGNCGCEKKHGKEGNPHLGTPVTYPASSKKAPVHDRAWVHVTSNRQRGLLRIPGGRNVPVQVLGVTRGKDGSLHAKVRATTSKKTNPRYRGRYRRLRRALTL